MLKPIINVKVKIPEEFMGDIMGDISNGHLMIPQAELHNYATTIRSLTINI